MMPLEQQVCSYELAQRLAALGVRQESVFWWIDRTLTYTGGRTSHAPRQGGIAAFTLMPDGTDILTVEFKTNLLAPARGERFAFRATVVKPGRTLTVCEGRAYAIHDGVETLIATMTGTLMALPRREVAAAAEGTRVPA